MHADTQHPYAGSESRSENTSNNQIHDRCVGVAQAASGTNLLALTGCTSTCDLRMYDYHRAPVLLMDVLRTRSSEVVPAGEKLLRKLYTPIAASQTRNLCLLPGRLGDKLKASLWPTDLSRDEAQRCSSTLARPCGITTPSMSLIAASTLRVKHIGSPCAGPVRGQGRQVPQNSRNVYAVLRCLLHCEHDYIEESDIV